MNTSTEQKTEKGKEEYDPAYIEIKGIGADDHDANIERVKECYKTEPAQVADPAPVEEITDPVIKIKEEVPEKTLKEKIDMDNVKLPIGKPIPLEDEVKILKALSNLMDEEPDPEYKKDMPERFFVMDISQILGFGPKTQEGRRILSRFYKHKLRTPEPNYKISGPSNYGINQLMYILKVFNYHKKGKGEPEPSITLTVMRNVPICIEDDNFICYLAPRISDQ